MADENSVPSHTGPTIKTMRDDAAHSAGTTPPAAVPIPPNVPVVEPVTAPLPPDIPIVEPETTSPAQPIRQEPSPVAFTPEPPPDNVPEPLHENELLATENENSDGHQDTDPFSGEVPASSGGSGIMQKFIQIGIPIIVLITLTGLGFFYGPRLLKQFLPGDSPVAEVTNDTNGVPEQDSNNDKQAPNEEPSTKEEVRTMFPGIGASTITVESTEAAQAALASMLLSAGNKESATVSFVTSTGDKFSSDDIFAAIGLNVPTSIRNNLSDTGMNIVIVSDEEAGASRLAIAVEISGDASTLNSALSAWEPTMSNDSISLYRLLGWSGDIPATPFTAFTRDDGIVINYSNVDGPPLAIDYVVDETRNVFIYATSRGSMSFALTSIK